MTPSKTILHDALKEANTDLTSSDTKNGLTIFINGDQIKTYTPITSGFAQKIAGAVAHVQNIEKEGDYFSGNIEIYIDVSLLFEIIHNAKIVNNILGAPGKEEIFMRDSDGIDIDYQTLWELLHDEQACNEFIKKLSFFGKNILRQLMIKLHSSRIPNGVSSVNQKTQFDWPEVKKESEKTRELRVKLGGDLGKDALQDFSVSELFDLAKNEKDLVRVTQYCILRYAAGMPLRP